MEIRKWWCLGWNWYGVCQWLLRLLLKAAVLARHSRWKAWHPRMLHIGAVRLSGVLRVGLRDWSSHHWRWWLWHLSTQHLWGLWHLRWLRDRCAHHWRRLWHRGTTHHWRCAHRRRRRRCHHWRRSHGHRSWWYSLTCSRIWCCRIRTRIHWRLLWITGHRRPRSYRLL